MGIQLCLTPVGKRLARLDITPQKPWRRAYERDPQAVPWWLDEIYPTLKKRAEKLGAPIFFLEEAGFQSDPPLGRTYGLKGQTPVVKIHHVPRGSPRSTWPCAPKHQRDQRGPGARRLLGSHL